MIDWEFWIKYRELAVAQRKVAGNNAQDIRPVTVKAGFANIMAHVISLTKAKK